MLIDISFSVHRINFTNVYHFCFQEPGYHPQVEAISPTPDDRTTERDDVRSTKEDLLQKISKVDREIAKAESQIAKLKKKQVLINLMYTSFNPSNTFLLVILTIKIQSNLNGTVLKPSINHFCFSSTSLKMPPTSQARIQALRRTLPTKAWHRWSTVITGIKSTRWSCPRIHPHVLFFQAKS